MARDRDGRGQDSTSNRAKRSDVSSRTDDLELRVDAHVHTSATQKTTDATRFSDPNVKRPAFDEVDPCSVKKLSVTAEHVAP